MSHNIIGTGIQIDRSEDESGRNKVTWSWLWVVRQATEAEQSKDGVSMGSEDESYMPTFPCMVWDR